MESGLPRRLKKKCLRLGNDTLPEMLMVNGKDFTVLLSPFTIVVALTTYTNSVLKQEKVEKSLWGEKSLKLQNIMQ